MARNNLFISQNDPSPMDNRRKPEVSMEDVTIPEDADPRRMMETQADIDPTERLSQDRRSMGDVPPRFSRQYEPTIIDDEVSIPRSPEKAWQRNRRVVGWMVGVKGSCRGIDFRLHEGKNYIGRDVRCEVNVEDPKVSSGSVAQVVFDPRSKRFFSSDCDGTATICYQNGEPLLGRSQIKMYDSIELGDSKLVFVPLCGEEFTWSDDEK